jgi:serine/threonine protein kinase
MDMSPGQNFGPYEIVGVLGAGGMGVVYRARDPRLGREVAIKTLPDMGANDPVRLKRFQQEVQAASALNHPNVITVYDVGEQAGVPYLVTELFLGQTLRERLREGPLGVRKAIDIAIQVARGLAAVHERGITHRDLKPDNLFILADGHVKILDFGIARATDAPSDGATIPHTQSGAVMGTAGYMSPEQVRGRPADARSDIFALGAILYEMITGGLAFPGDTPVERGYAILNSDPPDWSRTGVVLPVAVERVIRRCLEKAPEQRFQMARDLAFALEAITDTSGLQAQLEPGVPPKARFPFRATAALGAATLLAGLICGWWLSHQWPRNATALTSNPHAHFQRVTFRNGVIPAARFAKTQPMLVFSGVFEGDPLQVFTGSVGSPNTRPVTPPFTSLFGISSSDELALGSISFPLNREQGNILSKASLFGGAPREALEKVLWADYTPDGRELLVVRREGARSRIELPPGQVLLESSDDLTRARISPSGEYIAFERHPVTSDDRGRVEVIDRKGRLIARSNDAWTVEGLAWLPSSREVWFTAGEESPWRQLQALSVGGKEREVLRAPGNFVLHDIDSSGRVLIAAVLSRWRMFGRIGKSEVERPIAWLDGSLPMDLSADGQMLLFIEGQGGGGNEIQTYLRTMDGSLPVLLSEGWGRALSPDKKWALISPKPPFNTLTLVPTGPGSPRALPAGDFSSIGTVRWFPDGNRIALVGRDSNRRPHLYLQSLGAGPAPSEAPRLLSEEELEISAPPSPDGTMLPAVRRDGSPVLVKLPKGEVNALPGLRRGDQLLQWSPDGRELFVFRPTEKEFSSLQLLRYELGTSKSQVQDQCGPRDTVGIVGVRAGLITPDGKQFVYTAQQRLDELYVIEGLK